MKDVTRKRVVGAAVLVVLGILLPLLLARWLQPGESSGTDTMRVYDISPDGQATAADRDKNPDANTKKPKDAAAATAATGDTDTSDKQSAPPTPQAVSPAADSDDHDTTTASSVAGNGGAANGDDQASAQPPPSAAKDNNAQQGLRRTEKSGGWVVQVASFSNEDNARRLARQLSQNNDAFYRAGTVKGKTWYRVRLGPFDSKAKAQAKAATLRGEGRSTLVQRGE